MENVTINMVYEELKRIENTINKVDQRIENFMGFEHVSKKELKKLEKISEESKKSYKTLHQVAKELGVTLNEQWYLGG